jgi:DNA-binding transcriptional LysR family regulator
MLEENINRFLLFIVLAQEQSFTKAAARLGISQSALSHAIKALEDRVELRLFNRTTRSVSLTDAGDRLFDILAPRFSDIENELQSLNEEYHQAKGSIRISSSDYAMEAVLWPKLQTFARQFPQIEVEVNIENRLTNVVSERYDAGVRFGDQVDKDMVAMRISPDIRFLIVCSPDVLQNDQIPVVPNDLYRFPCVNLRLNSSGGIYAWELEKGKEEYRVKVEGQFTFNSSTQILQATLAGFGLAYLPDNLVQQHIESGKLVTVLEDWCPPCPGLHIYYPSRHQHRMAFQLLLDHLKVE